MPIINLYLVRHGRTDYNDKGLIQGRLDIPLNALGEKQAKALGQALKNVDFDDIWTSPLGRCVATAEAVLLSGPANSQIQLDPRLYDREMGAWNSTPVDHGDEAEPEDAERWPAVRERVAECLSEILQRYGGSSKDTDILIASHEAPIALLGQILIDLAGPYKVAVAPGVTVTRDVKNTSISKVTLERKETGWEGTVVSWSDAAHVPTA